MGAALKVTCEPAQVVLLPPEILIDTDGVTVGVTIMLIELDVTVAVLTQLALEVSIHATTSPLTKLDVV